MRSLWLIGMIGCLALWLASALVAQPFTYQGFLKQSGTPANGTFNMTFRLYDALTGGNQIGSPITQNVSVQNGLFTVALDFGAVWTGADRYLEIQVGSTTLSPRVKVTATPYALYALKPWEPNGSAIFYNGGNVGIGTNSPAARLHIVGGNLRVDDGEIQSWGTITLHPDVDNTGDDIIRFVDSTGNETMRIHSNGNVGIGTSSPAALLSLGGGNANTKLALWQGNSTGQIMGLGVGAGQFRLHLNHPGDRFSFLNAPNGNELVTIYGDGKVGISTTSSPIHQLHVVATSSHGAIYGEAPITGVIGWSTANSGTTYGVYGASDSPDGRGVYGLATATTGFTYGVYGRSHSPSGTGVYGLATATTGPTWGVYGRSESPSGTGVVGWARATTGFTWGVYGWSESPSGYGVYSQGRFGASGTKSFQIDHPLMPETHYLNHFCTEAPEPLNAYSGVVVLDARGEAWVQLPHYFEAVNRDPRYTLTPIGAPMPNLHVAVEIQANRFKIAGGVPGKKVSWRVEAVRNDRWVQQYGFQTEQPKPDEHKGKYLHPELYGQPKEKGIFYHPEPERPVKPNREEARPN